MKKNSSIFQLLVMFCFVLLILLFVLIIFLVRKIQGFEVKVDNNKKEIIKTHVIKKNYSIDNIDSISFDFMNSKVYYHSYDKDKILITQKGKVSSYLVNKKLDKKKLYISESSTSIFGKLVFNIYIPKEYIYSIKIKNGFGNMKIDDFNNHLTIDNNAGNVLIGNVGDTVIKNTSGIIKIGNVIGQLDINSSTGDLFISKADGSVNIETITGSILINDFIIDDQSDIYTTSGDIDIKINKESDCLLKYKKNENYKINKKKCKNGENTLSIKNVTGNVIIK